MGLAFEGGDEGLGTEHLTEERVEVQPPGWQHVGNSYSRHKTKMVSRNVDEGDEDCRDENGNFCDHGDDDDGEWKEWRKRMCSERNVERKGNG